MTLRYDCREPGQRTTGLQAAAAAIKRGDLVVVPTETSYAVVCDAFGPAATDRLRSAKGRPSGTPLSVLVGTAATIEGLAYGLSPEARELMAAFWPGQLTIVARCQPSLQWDLGTPGEVAVRMPIHPLLLDLLATTGPVASSGANSVSAALPITCDAAVSELGDEVAVYLDSGELSGGTGSAFVDCTQSPPTCVRTGSVRPDQLRRVVPEITGLPAIAEPDDAGSGDPEPRDEEPGDDEGPGVTESSDEQPVSPAGGPSGPHE